MQASAAATSTHRPWWETRWFVSAMILLAAVPLLYPPVPPLVDLPGHIGRFRVELGLSQSPFLQRYYDYHWALIGNLGLDLLIIPFGKLFGVELGTKILVMATPMLTVAGFLWVAREVHHRLPPTVLFALPFAYGHPFMFGFANFSFSMALAFLGFGLWLRLGRLGKTRLRAALFVPISLIVFISHTFGWGTLGLLCFSAEAVRQHDLGHSWWKSGLKAAQHASVLAAPLLLLALWRHEAQGSGGTADWFDWHTKGSYLLMALRDRWYWIDRGSLMVPIAAFVFALVLPQLALSRNLAFSALVLSAIFVCLPRIIFGSAFADMRLVPYLFAVLVMAVRFRGDTDLKVGQVLAVLGLAFVLFRTTVNTVSLAMASRETQRELAAVSDLPVGSRVLFLAGGPCKEIWPLPRKSQLGALLIARKDALVNSEWRMPGAQLLSVRNADKLGWFSNDPSQQVRSDRCGNREHWAIDRSLASFPRDQFDYAWMVDVPPFSPQLIAGWQQLYRDGDSALYRIRPGA